MRRSLLPARLMWCAEGEWSTRALPVAKVIVASLLVSGCANSYASHQPPSGVGVWGPVKVAVATPPKTVEMEDDGLAVQAPPRVHKQREPDDPSEPFSPNYGPAPASEDDRNIPQNKLVVPQRQATAAPPRFRSRVTPMSPREASDIMVRAMIAHEMRNQ